MTQSSKLIKKPKFSIVTISFNQQNFLRQSIDSVLNQTFDDFQYIIVDGGSSDKSREIINSYKSDKRIKIIFQNEDKGPVHSLNDGFKNTTGEILGYVNSDDFFLKNSLEIVNNIFKKNEEFDLIFGSVHEVDQNNYLRRNLYSKDFSMTRFRLEQCFICQQATFFKKKIFDKTKGFNTENKLNWDLEIVADLVKSGAKFKKIDEFLGCFRIYPGTFTSSTENNFRKSKYENMLKSFFKKKNNYLDYLLRIIIYLIDRVNFKFLLNKLKGIVFKFYKIKIYYDYKK